MIRFLIIMTIVMSGLSSTCKVRNSDNKSNVKLIGGESAAMGLFPATVHIYMVGQEGNGGHCGAGKIDQRKFLTAAHCFKAIDVGKNSPITLFIGNQYEKAETIDAIITSTSIFNINLESVTSAGFGLDLAVFQINVDTPQIAIAQLSNSPIKSGDTVILSGYGCTSDDITPSDRGNLKDLFFGRVKVKSIEAAHLFLDRYDVEGRETRLCPGDSGTPVYLADSAQGPYMKIVGVNSFRKVIEVPDNEEIIWGAVARMDSNLSASRWKWLTEHGLVSPYQSKSIK